VWRERESVGVGVHVCVCIGVCVYGCVWVLLREQVTEACGAFMADEIQVPHIHDSWQN